MLFVILVLLPFDPVHLRVQVRSVHVDRPDLDSEVIMVEWQQETMITNSTPYLLGGCSHVDTKVLDLCEGNGEDLATPSTKNLLIIKI